MHHQKKEPTSRGIVAKRRSHVETRGEGVAQRQISLSFSNRQFLCGRTKKHRAIPSIRLAMLVGRRSCPVPENVRLEVLNIHSFRALKKGEEDLSNVAGKKSVPFSYVSIRKGPPVSQLKSRQVDVSSSWRCCKFLHKLLRVVQVLLYCTQCSEHRKEEFVTHEGAPYQLPKLLLRYSILTTVT